MRAIAWAASEGGVRPSTFSWPGEARATSEPLRVVKAWPSGSSAAREPPAARESPRGQHPERWATSPRSQQLMSSVKHRSVRPTGVGARRIRYLLMCACLVVYARRIQNRILPLQLHGVDENIGKSKRILTAMSRQMSRNKLIIRSIVAALVLAIVLILYFKLNH
ncbi:hypothetical protein Dimus_029401 [Dionaea muscipula]